MRLLLFLLNISTVVAMGGSIGCVVTKNKLFSHGNYIRSLSRMEIGQMAKYKREIMEFRRKVDDALEKADEDGDGRVGNSTLPPMPPRPEMPPFCHGKDTILYIFPGCTVQNNKVFVGRTFARELEANERNKLSEFLENMTEKQEGLATTIHPQQMDNDLDFCVEL